MARPGMTDNCQPLLPEIQHYSASHAATMNCTLMVLPKTLSILGS